MKYLCLFVSLTLCINCSGQKTGDVKTGGIAAKPPAFQMVSIPGVLVNPAERADYLVEHYWDNFDFSDTAYIHLPEITEQAFVDYIDILPYTSVDITALSIKKMLKNAEAEEKVFSYFTKLYEKYLYEPNSPMRNDEYYIPVLEALLSSPLVKEKTRPASLLELARKNRLGEPAANFTYTLANGQKKALYDLNAPYTLLFFYNPDCHNCQEVSRQLQASLSVGALMKKGQLTVLAVYTDEDLKAWRNYIPQMPAEWIISHDEKRTILEKEIYDLKAIPTLYLLDSKKNVLLKDPVFGQLEDYLKQRLTEE
jgi:hypothetical protein